MSRCIVVLSIVFACFTNSFRSYGSAAAAKSFPPVAGENSRNGTTFLGDDTPLLQVPGYRIKSALLLNIAENIIWPNEQSIKIYEILVVDPDTLIYSELKRVENAYLLKGRPIRVSRAIQTLKNPESYSIVFLSESRTQLINMLYQQVAYKGVLLITDNGAERILSMVNLYFNQQKKSIAFEVNRQALEENGFKLTPKLIALGGSFIDIKELYLKTYQKLTEESHKLEQLQRELNSFRDEKRQYENQLAILSKELETLTYERTRMEKEYANLSQRFEQKDSLLQSTSQELSNKVAESQRLQNAIDNQVALINYSKSKLDSLNQKIGYTQQVLDQQQREIREQGVVISEKENIILKQRRRFYLLLVFLFSVSISLLFAFWAYRIKRRLNLKLENLVQERTKELNISRSHFQSLFDNSPVAMLELDLSGLLEYVKSIGIDIESMNEVKRDFSVERVRDGLKYIRINNINSAAIELFGFSCKDDATANYTKTYNEESLSTFQVVYRALIEQKSFCEYESIRRTKDGKNLYVILKWLVLPGYMHDYSKVLLAITDITKIKNYEKELTRHRDHLEEIVKERTQEILRLNEELQVSNEELVMKTEELEQTIKMLEDAQRQLVHQEKMASLGMLTAGIAHEINNPINYISASHQAMVSLLDELWESYNYFKSLALKHSQPQHHLPHISSDEELYGSLKVLLSSIEKGIERTTGIIRSLKAFARSDSEALVETYIPDVVADVLTMLRGSYFGRIEVVQHYDDNLPKIRCSSNQLHQVLMNLLSNAIDAIPEEGKILISANYSRNAELVTIRVKDTGKGMTQEVMEKIFDPFFTTKEVGKGAGLGLYITYNIVKALNGSINVNSVPGEGTEFTVEIPFNDETSTPQTV